MKKKFLLVLVGLTMLVSLAACGKKEEVGDRTDELFERGYLVMGMDDTFAPMGFRDKAGNLVGFDVDLAQVLFDKMGVEVKFQPVDWTMKETELNSGNIDVIWNGYSITKERAEKVNFSDVYLENKQIIVTMKGSGIESKEDLAGKKVAVQSASSALEAVNKEPEVVASFAGKEPVLFDTNHEAIMDMEAGRSDAIVGDEVLLRYYIKEKNPDDYIILEDDFGEETYGIGVRKADEKLLAEINRVLGEMKKDGSYDEVYKKWFQD